MASSVFNARARVAVAAREGDPAKREQARRDLAEAKLAQYIERVVSEAPPLTSDQRHRLTLLLRGAA